MSPQDLVTTRLCVVDRCHARSDFFIVCAPVFISAAIYLGLTLSIDAATSSLSDSTVQLLPRFVTPKSILAVFIVADTLTIIMQVAGAALIGAAYSAIADGRKFSLVRKSALDLQKAHILTFSLPAACTGRHQTEPTRSF